MSVEVDQVSFSYCTRDVLHNVSFVAQPGQLLTVLGPNGVGKSTLFRCILGIHTKYTGEIRINGKEVRSYEAKELAKQIAYIPQSREQCFSYSVEDMVLMGTSHQIGTFSQPSDKEKKAVKESLEKLGISHLINRNYCHLSGGEQQLVLIARALAQQAKILLMDEPTSSLDFGNQQLVLSSLKELTKEGYTAIVSTHNPQQTLWYANQVLALQNGCVAAYGNVDSVMTTELMQSLYGGNVRLVSAEGERFLSPKGGCTHV